jgi:hypothetical protein
MTKQDKTFVHGYLLTYTLDGKYYRKDPEYLPLPEDVDEDVRKSSQTQKSNVCISVWKAMQNAKKVIDAKIGEDVVFDRYASFAHCTW